MPARNARPPQLSCRRFTAVEDVFEGERNFYVAYAGSQAGILGEDLAGATRS